MQQDLVARKEDTPNLQTTTTQLVTISDNRLHSFKSKMLVLQPAEKV